MLGLNLNELMNEYYVKFKWKSCFVNKEFDERKIEFAMNAIPHNAVGNAGKEFTIIRKLFKRVSKRFWSFRYLKQYAEQTSLCRFTKEG